MLVPIIRVLLLTNHVRAREPSRALASWAPDTRTKWIGVNQSVLSFVHPGFYSSSVCVFVFCVIFPPFRHCEHSQTRRESYHDLRVLLLPCVCGRGAGIQHVWIGAAGRLSCTGFTCVCVCACAYLGVCPCASHLTLESKCVVTT